MSPDGLLPAMHAGYARSVVLSVNDGPCVPQLGFFG